MRETSLEAFEYLRDSGRLSKKRFEVYALLFQHGPITAGELFQKDPKTLVKGSICARLTELREMDLAKEVGTKECELTHKNVILWEVTARKEPLPFRRKQKLCPHCGGEIA